ncbi:MAG: hypothetical protein KF724_05705 [Phycisphaeraceae bacterium]|nr:hypothetical protein [Phycisphaeraceae bacterium]
MIDGGPHHDPREHPAEDALLRQLLSELAAGRERAPDLTDAVMGRLGFVRCSALEASRERRDRMLRRCGILALALLAAFAGYLVAPRGEAVAPQALAPAVGGVMERKGQSFAAIVDGLPRFRVSEASWSQAPGTMPMVPLPAFVEWRVLVIPMPVVEQPVAPMPDFLDRDCPSLRRAAASVPFPQT